MRERKIEGKMKDEEDGRGEQRKRRKGKKRTEEEKSIV